MLAPLLQPMHQNRVMTAHSLLQGPSVTQTYAAVGSVDDRFRPRPFEQGRVRRVKRRGDLAGDGGSA